MTKVNPNKDKIKELRDQGIAVHSYSKLGTYHNCQYEYFQTYVQRNRGKQNCYGHVGGELHDGIEGIYKDEVNRDQLRTKFNASLSEIELLNMDFPNEKIKNAFVADVMHFIDNFKKLDGKFLLEQHFLFKIGEHWFQGYVDAIHITEDKKIQIIDWKSSSKFAGKKLPESGRQLLTYKLALESTTKHKVDKLMWCMLKYAYVTYMQKNGKLKQKMVNRSKWVKEMEKPFIKDLSGLGYDELEIDIMMSTAIKTNSIDGLPQEIKDKYTLEDCYLEYEATDENMVELEYYVNSTIEEIEAKDHKDEKDWKPLIHDEKESFYCNVLCGYRDSCKYRKEYIEKNDFKKKDRNQNMIDQLLQGGL